MTCESDDSSSYALAFVEIAFSLRPVLVLVTGMAHMQKGGTDLREGDKSGVRQTAPSRVGVHPNGTYYEGNRSAGGAGARLAAG